MTALRDLAVLVAAFVIGLIDAPGVSMAADGCELKLALSLPATVMGQADTILVPARIGDRSLRMLFDTGAAFTLIEGKVAEEAGLRLPARRTMRIAGLGGEADVFRVPLVPLALDRATLDQPFIFVTDPQKLLYQNQFDGLLGLATTGRFDIEIDLQALRINLFLADHCPGQVVYWADEYSTIPFKRSAQNLIEVAVKIDGETLRGIIDTGASHTSISWRAAHDDFKLTTSSPGVYSAGAARTADGRSLSAAQFTFDTLEVGELKVRHPVVRIIEQYSMNILTDLGMDDWAPQVVIGMDLLKHLRLYVANKERMIYFTVAPPPA